jgi:hypothetical protein
MIDSVITATLAAFSGRGQGKIDVFQTVFTKGRTVTASVSLSAFTNGEENGRMGVATAIISKAGAVTSPGHTDTLPLPPADPYLNQIHIPNCSFVTFRMGVEMAEAIAVATVFVEGGALKMSTRMHSAWIVDKGSGRVRGLHKIALAAGTKVPSAALVLRRVRECAAQALGVDVRSITTVLARRPPAVVTTGLVIDGGSGRVRRIAGARARRATMLESVLRHD